MSKPEFDYIDKSNLNDAEKDKSNYIYIYIYIYLQNNKIEDLKLNLIDPLEADKNKIIEQIAKLSGRENKITSILP